MATSTNPLVNEVFQLFPPAIATYGFRKRQGNIYTMELAPEILGWIGLNTASRRADGRLEINPVVGVRHQAIEREVARLCEERFHQYIPPTISTSLGYATPQRQYVACFVASVADAPKTIRELVDVLREYGVPWMKTYASLEAITRALAERKYALAQTAAYRLPVAYRLLGREREAKHAVEQYLATLAERNDMAAEDFHRFARRLRGEFNG